MKIVTLRIDVTVPDDVNSEQVAHRINEALDEPPCNWEDWTVSSAFVNFVERLEDPDDQES